MAKSKLIFKQLLMKLFKKSFNKLNMNQKKLKSGQMKSLKK